MQPQLETRTRQVPVTTSYVEEVTKYNLGEEQRDTLGYEIRYKPNVYTRHTWEPRIAYGYYNITEWKDVPFITFET